MGKWKPQGGGPVPGIYGPFTDAFFGYREDYASGEALVLTLTGPRETDDGVEDEVNLFFSVGKGWDTEDDGASVTHEQGYEAFHPSTTIGRVLSSLFGVVKQTIGGDDEDAEEYLTERFGDPLVAESYTKLGRVRFAEKKYMDRDRQERTFLAPVELLDGDEKKKGTGAGKAGTGKPAAKAESAKPAAKPAATRGRGAKAKAEEVEETAVEEKPARRGRKGKDPVTAMREKLVAWAAEFEDHDEFVTSLVDEGDDAFEDQDALQNDEQFADLLAEALDPEEGIWTESRDEED